MYTIVGLGNPGEKYELTRHNVGQIVLRKVFNEIQSLDSGKVETVTLADIDCRVAFPDTYMNESGNFMRRLLKGDKADNLIVVYDDVDLPLGEFKITFGRGDGGHNGLASIINNLQTKDFTRIRIGISKKNFWGNMVRVRGEELADFVLGRLSPKEIKVLENLTPRIKEVLETIAKDGVNVAMNKFN